MADVRKTSLNSFFDQIESVSEIKFNKFPLVLPFGGEKESAICDFFNSNGDKTWSLIDFDSGEIVRHVIYEPGYGYHWGSLVFNISASGSAVVVLDPEFTLGIAFFKDEDGLKADPREWRKDFYETCFWRKECYKDAYHLKMIDEWMATLEDITGFPRLTL